MKALIPALILIFFCINHSIFAQWDKYPTYPDYIQMMEKFETDYPEFCKVVEFGTTSQGRKLLCAKVSDNVNTKEAEPEFLYTATMHGNELPGYVFMLRLIDTLLTGYSTYPQIKNLVDNIEIWINPLLNPDGTYKAGDSTVLGAVGHIGYNVDMNRDFLRLPETGTSPDPQVETKAIMDFMKGHHFVMSANFHAGMEAVIYPWHCISRIHTDKKWFIHVAREYADTAQEYGPDGFFTYMDNGITNGFTLYPAIGTKIDWSNYYMHCREVQIELSNTKMLPETQLDNFWDYNYKSFLNYIEQVLYGIRGTVIDGVTREGIRAKVFVEDHDSNADSSFVYSDSSGRHGNYYRPIHAGAYDVTFSCEWYQPITIEDVVVRNNEATIVDVEFYPTDINKTDLTNGKNHVSIVPFNKGIKVVFGDIEDNIKVGIFDISGRLVTGLIKSQQGILWNGSNNSGQSVPNGCYIVHVDFGDKTLAKRFILSR